LTADGKRDYGTWSRGMRQRLKLGWALSGDAGLVLLDEPFLGVDPPSRRFLTELIRRLAAEGRTVMLTSHVLSEIEALTSRVAVLAHGRLLGFGQLEDLLRSLRDRHPHRVHLDVIGDPRPLGEILLRRADTLEVRITGPNSLSFLTSGPDTLYPELPGIIAASGAAVWRLQAPDDTLEAVFRHVTKRGRAGCRSRGLPDVAPHSSLRHSWLANTLMLRDNREMDSPDSDDPHLGAGAIHDLIN
jgi:ABC-2 type transport system ATP-binding protein